MDENDKFKKDSKIESLDNSNAIERIRKYEGFENISDAEAEEIATTIHKLADIAIELYQAFKKAA